MNLDESISIYILMIELISFAGRGKKISSPVVFFLHSEFLYSNVNMLCCKMDIYNYSDFIS